MENLQPKMEFECIEILVSVKKPISGLNAKRRDHTVDRLPHGDSIRSEKPVIVRSGDRYFRRERLQYRQFQKPPARLLKLSFGTRPLQNLAENHTGQSNRLVTDGFA
jgi:hypothetical protein